MSLINENFDGTFLPYWHLDVHILVPYVYLTRMLSYLSALSFLVCLSSFALMPQYFAVSLIAEGSSINCLLNFSS